MKARPRTTRSIDPSATWNSARMKQMRASRASMEGSSSADGGAVGGGDVDLVGQVVDGLGGGAGPADRFTDGPDGDDVVTGGDPGQQRQENDDQRPHVERAVHAGLPEGFADRGDDRGDDRGGDPDENG